MPALPSSFRLPRLQSVACSAQMTQQKNKRPTQSPASWDIGELKSADMSRPDSKAESLSTTTTPLDVLLDDVRFLEAKTGLDLMTPLQEVKGVHDQVSLIACILLHAATHDSSDGHVGFKNDLRLKGVHAQPLELCGRLPASADTLQQ